MPHTLLAIQYKPRPAGMMKQNQMLMRGIIRFTIFMLACCSWDWPLLLVMTMVCT